MRAKKNLVTCTLFLSVVVFVLFSGCTSKKNRIKEVIGESNYQMAKDYISYPGQRVENDTYKFSIESVCHDNHFYFILCSLTSSKSLDLSKVFPIIKHEASADKIMMQTEVIDYIEHDNNQLFFFVLVRSQSALNKLALCIDRFESPNDGCQWDKTENLTIILEFSEAKELSANDMPTIKNIAISPISFWIEDYEKKATTSTFKSIKEFVIVYKDGSRIGFTGNHDTKLSWSITQKPISDHTVISVYFSQYIDIQQIDYIIYEGFEIPLF